MRAARALALAVLAAAVGCATVGVEEGARERGDAAFRRGDYVAAAEAYETMLAERGADTDEVVYLRLAVLHLVLGTPDRDPARGRAVLERMTVDHPRGELREVADTMLSLHARVAAERRESGAAGERVRRLEARIQELERQVETLKSIDLEGRRPPPD